jgi:phage shock protein C
MGDPREIAGDKGKNVNEPSYTQRERPYGRKGLFRDPDNRVLGGVCSGLGYYMEVDPVILRVILAVLFLAFGFGMLVYLILWIAIPKAVTTAQKLEMRGESVNASTIGNFDRMNSKD